MENHSLLNMLIGMVRDIHDPKARLRKRYNGDEGVPVITEVDLPIPSRDEVNLVMEEILYRMDKG